MIENSKIKIRQEKKEDYFIVENLVRESFWNVYRPGCNEHFIVNQYRDSPNFIKELSFVLEYDKKIIGYIMYSKSKLNCDDGTEKEVITFGPLAIHPEYQRQGYGKKLVDYSLNKATKLGYPCVFISGDINFYKRCGFVISTSKGIRYAEDLEGEAPYFLCKELKLGFLEKISAIYKDPKEYFVSQEKSQLFEEYDKKFASKEKLKLPSQIF